MTQKEVEPPGDEALFEITFKDAEGSRSQLCLEFTVKNNSTQPRVLIWTEPFEVKDDASSIYSGVYSQSLRFYNIVFYALPEIHARRLRAGESFSFTSCFDSESPPQRTEFCVSNPGLGKADLKRLSKWDGKNTYGAAHNWILDNTQVLYWNGPANEP